MIAAFTRGPENTVQVEFPALDARTLSGLFGELGAMIDAELAEQGGPQPPDPLAEQLGLTGLGSGSTPGRPRDPAIARLFPDAYPEDAQASAEFRRFTQADLGSMRRRRIEVTRASLERIPRGGRLVLDAGEAAAWLGALNDLRLVLGSRLEITADGQEPGESLAPDDPRHAHVPVYYYLGYLEETLVEALGG